MLGRVAAARRRAPEVRAVKIASATRHRGAGDEGEAPVDDGEQPADQRRERERPGLHARERAHARVRCCGGTISASVASRSGVRNAFEAPWTKRAATKIVSVGATRRDQRADGVGDEAGADDARDAQALADRARDELQRGERDQVGRDRGRHRVARGVEASPAARAPARSSTAPPKGPMNPPTYSASVALRERTDVTTIRAGPRRGRGRRRTGTGCLAGEFSLLCLLAGRVPARPCVCTGRTSDPPSYAAADDL